MLNSNVHLGCRIKTWRTAKGLTQRQLAKKIGISTTAVHYWEREDGLRTSPKERHLTAAVAAFGISMERFYGRLPKVKARA